MIITTNDIIFVSKYVFMKTYKKSKPDTTQLYEPVAAYKLSGTTSVTDSGLQVVHDARAGIKFKKLLNLGEIMALSLSDLARILNLSLRTIQRYDTDFVLDADASSKIIQLSILQDKGLEVFGDQSAFNDWLRMPMRELDGGSPLEFLDTPFGYQILHQVLGRIEHGIFA